MHGRFGGEEERRTWHMWPVPANAGAAAAPPISPRPLRDSVFDRSCDGFFLKDGRKIHIGDCALFQSGNSPAFIGIIRSLSSVREDHPKLIVNWLYRPADIKLGKGILVEAAPNEVFYSFHKDEISAESLLHPCKVAFLRRGVELPPRISSFVCRRVYDIANKCLWWLTDQDYIRERQEEVNQLLDKSQIEMHTAVHSGGQSPKPTNGSSPMQQLKSSSDSVQNGGPSGATHVKSKRRENPEQNSEIINREHVIKVEDGDSGNFIPDGILKDEVAKISDKGGLVDSTGVDKLIGLMQLDKEDRKIDLPGRLLLADVIAATATDRFDCLGRFVQLKGLLVLDDWLQEAHKGKGGENGSLRYSDKSYEELVLVLLRALEKLPVNLHALQTSNIGKSVNNFRSHKNPEIQKKARSLVDTWKKRVDAEFMKNDAKFVASSQAVQWSAKTGLSEATAHGGTRRMLDTVLKNSSQLPTFKSVLVKPCNGDAVMKSISAPPGSSKSPMPMSYPMASCTNDASSRISVMSTGTDLQFTAVKEEKSTGSSKSLNNMSSKSASRKDDIKNLTSGSPSAGKTSSGLGRRRKSSTGFSGTGISSFNKPGTVNRSPASKVLQPSATSEQVLDPPSADHGNGHRLMVRLPNPGKSPAQSTSGSSSEEPSVVGSRASSPNAYEKHGQSDLIIRTKEDASLTNSIAEKNTGISNDNKCAVASNESAQLPSALHNGSTDNGIVGDVLKDGRSLSTSEKGCPLPVFNSRKQCDPSLCSMNALIESCVKYPEACASLLAGDDLGMNLLASVATEEMLKSETVHSNAYHQSSPAVDCLSNGNDKLNMPHDTIIRGSDLNYSKGVAHERSASAGIFKEPPKADIIMSDMKNDVFMLEEFKVTGGNTACTDFDGKPGSRSIMKEEPALISQEDAEVGNGQMQVRHGDGGIPDDKYQERSPSEDKRSSCNSHDWGTSVGTCGYGVVCGSSDNVGHTASDAAQKGETADNGQIHPVDIDVEKNEKLSENPVVSRIVGQKSSNAGDDLNMLNITEEAPSLGSINSEICDALTSKKAECAEIKCNSEPSENEKKAEPCTTHPTFGQIESTQAPFGDNSSDDCVKKYAPGSIGNEKPTVSPSKESEQCTELMPSNCSYAKVDDTIDPKSCKGTSSLTSDCTVGASMLDFDLNEGIDADDVSQAEVATVVPLSCPFAACQPDLAPSSVSTSSRGCPVTIPIAAPAKGPFMPPENLLRSKGEPGWKGSAATSAFRRAEPRKVLEMAISTPDTSSGLKQSRPSFDIDLNVADSRLVDDMVYQRLVQKNSSESRTVTLCEELVHYSRLGLDLNKSDEGIENAQNIASTSRRWEPSHLAARISSGGFSKKEGLRDFDLNNGPGAEAILESTMQKQSLKSSVLHFLPPVSSYRMNSAELGNMSSWFPARSAYSAVPMPSFLSEKADCTYSTVAPTGVQRFLGSASGPVGSSFMGDNYRAVLPSSPAMAFTAATPFTQPNFQFPSGFPLSSASFPVVSTSFADSSPKGACLPTVVSPLVGQANGTSSPYIRPYVISLSDSSASGGGSEGARKWGGQSLDLNAGPGGLDIESRAERLPSSSHQPSNTSQPLFPDEAGRIYQVSGSGFKRKEPEAGWDTERYTYKQLPWQ